MKMHISIYIFPLILLFAAFCQADDTCSLDEKNSCTENARANKYSKDENEKSAKNAKYAKYYEAVEKAKSNYVKCESKRCKCFTDVITNDLKIFSKHGIDRSLIEAAKPRGTFYQVIDGQLYRERNCMFPSRCTGIEYFLSRVIKNVSDIELVINTRDYPQSSKYFGDPLPVLSFSKTPDYYDIMYPAWAFWAGGPAIKLYPNGIGRWDTHRLMLDDARERYPWERKKSMGFFRGSRTSSERDNLVLLSRAKPKIVDAQYTKNQAWKSEADTLNKPPASEVALEKHCEYKYLFNYRGVAASFRHKHLFLCGSLVFHVGDEWKEFYYDALKPWIHYIPVPKDASQKELEEIIQFAMDNDDIARSIADNGRNFIWEKLRFTEVICYWTRLIKRYSKLIKFKPKLDRDLMRIYQMDSVPSDEL